MSRLSGHGSIKLTVLVMTIGVFLSGCIGGSDTNASVGSDPGLPTSADQGQFDDTTGALTGFVFNDEAVAVAGVNLQLIPGGREAKSAQDGSYSFSRIEPGSYTLFAGKIGFDMAIMPVNIVAGEMIEKDVQLTETPIPHPRNEILGPYEGRFDCRWGTPTSAGPCGWAGVGGVDNSAVTNVLWTEDNRFEFPLTGDDWQEIRFDTQWSPSSFATNPNMNQIFSYSDRTTSHWFARSSVSGSPLSWSYVRGEEGPNAQLPDGQPEEPNMNLTLRTWLSVPFGTVTNPVGIAYEMRFKMMVTIFYDMRAPEGFSAFLDA